MAYVLTPYAVMSAGTAVVALLVAFFAWRRRHAPGGKSLTALMLAVAFWSAGTAFEYVTVSTAGKLFWSKVEYIGVLSCPVFYLLFALEYNRLDRWLTRRNVALLFVIPLLTLALAFTNEWHLLIWTSVTPTQNGDNLVIYGHGLGFWVSAVGYAYLLMLIATVLFIRAALRLPGLFRRQVIMIIVAALAPWVVNAIYISGLSPVPGLELTPLVLVFSGIVFAWAIFGVQLLTVAPIARQTMIETMAEGMVALDAADRVVDINPAARHLIGAPPSFALGQPITQLLSAWPAWEERYWRRGVNSAEVTLDGATVRYLKLTITALQNRRGKPGGRLLTMHDITARRNTEAELRQQNEYLRALQNTAMEFVAQLDLPSLLENIVRRAAQLMGTDAGYLDLVDPETQQLKPQVGIGILAESLDHPAAPGEGVAGTVWQTGELLVIDDYDSWRGRIASFSRSKLQAVVGVPLRLGDEILGVLGLAYPAGSGRTFTPQAVEVLTQFASLATIAISNARLYDRVQREKLYFESLLANSPVATAIIDLDGHIISWNPAAEAIFGYTQREAIGRSVDDLVANDDSIRDEARTLTDQTYTAGLVHVLTRRTRKDGALIEVELWAIPIVIGDKPVGGMAIYHDITELQQARHAAEAAARVKSDFLASMSHELRTPLNSILGFSDLLARDAALAPAERANAAIIGRSGEHLLAMINDVLAMASLESGHVTLQATEFDLHRMFADLLDMFRLRAEAKGLGLHLVWTPTCQGTVYGDEGKLRQVMINLIGNAIKFTAAGAVTVTVEKVAAAGGPRLVCTVEDTGPGIAPADQALIFEPFVQAGQRGAHTEGTGLGLPISRQFARLMGGDITVTSSGIPGEGSRFRFEAPWPGVDAAPPGADAPAGAMPAAPLAPAPSTAAQLIHGDLPAGWREQVRRASVAVDTAALHRLVAQVAVDQPGLAAALQAWIEAYDYAAIQQAMEE